MRTNRNRWLAVAAAITIAVTYPRAAVAQTAAELMQKGIYTQETAGDLDGAIAIYRQIANSGSSPRDLAAQAQYRLAQSLLQKGDLGNAATEFSNLARNYADYGKLVSSMAAMARGSTSFPRYAAGAGGRTIGPINFDQFTGELADGQATLQRMATLQAAGAASPADVDRAKARLSEMQAKLAEAQALGAGQQTSGMFSGVSFDGGAPVTIRGVVVEAVWVNPASVFWVDPQDGSGNKYAFQAVSPNQMLKQGWTRQTVKAGDQITVSGVLAVDRKMLRPDTFAASATTITLADGRKLFDRAAVQK